MRRLGLTLLAVLALAGVATAIELKTDTSKALVPLDEIIPGGPLPDGIPPIDRTVDGAVLDFGTSGKLYRSDLVMYDRQSHSLWAQMEGRALVGARAGTRLTMLPSNTIAFETWRAVHATGKVLSRETGHQRNYGANPYESYDEPGLRPFLFSGHPDPRRLPKERVVGVKIGDAARAYPWPTLAQQRVVHDAFAGEALVIFCQPGTLSALDRPELAESRDVAATGVFSRRLGERMLTFEATSDGFRDRETGSTWNLLGVPQRGPMAGKRLRAIPHVDAFWFAWAAFNPATSVHE